MSATTDETEALTAAFLAGQITRYVWLAELAKLRQGKETVEEREGSDEDSSSEELESQARVCSPLRSMSHLPSLSSATGLSPSQSRTDSSSIVSFNSRLDEELAAASTLQDLQIRPGITCRHETKGEVKVIRLGGPQDFFNSGRVYISCEQLKRGCTHKYETKHLWVPPSSLTPSNHTNPSQSLHEVGPTQTENLDQNHGEEENEAELSDLGNDLSLPTKAPHERKRKVPDKIGGGEKRGKQRLPSKLHKSRTTPEARIAQFPGEPLQVLENSKIKCLACKRSYRNKWSDIQQHVRTDLHIKATLDMEMREKDDATLKEDLAAYFKKHPEEVMSTIDSDEMLYWYRVVQVFLFAGVELNKVDDFRPLLRRSGYSLTSATHLSYFIPKIHEAEVKLLKSEIQDQYIGIAFDGTTRLGEAINVTGRFCNARFELEKRLLDFTTLAKHVNNVELAAHLGDVIGRVCGIPVNRVVGLFRDSVSINGAACRRLKNVYTSAVDLMCICHTLCHVGEHSVLETLDAFMTPWLELVGGRNPHVGARSLWKSRVAPARVPGYSQVRWYAKAEIIFVIGEAGTRRLREFLDDLDEYGYGDATRAKLRNIYTDKGDELRLQIAAMLDVRELVRTTYALEGDRLEILLAFERIEALRSLGRAITAGADGALPNVDGVLRRLMELKKGVGVSKYFQGHGIVTGKLVKKDKVHSTLYPGTERDAWRVVYPDGFEEDFEEEELRSGKDGPAPADGDGRPVLVVRHLPQRKAICDALAPGFAYLEARLTGTCDSQYDCSHVYKIYHAVRAFDANFAANRVDEDFVDKMQVITPLANMHLLDGLKQELPMYLSACANAPVFDRSDVEAYTDGVLLWWRQNGGVFPCWATAARIAFAFSPNSASCERVFSLLKEMFGEQQMRTLGDYISIALKLRYHKRRVG